MNTSSSYRHLDVEQRASGVTIVTMNRPEVLNAVNWDMHTELEHLFVDLDQDKSIKAIVLTGAGRGFCSGGDQKAADTDVVPSPTRGGRHLIRNMLEVEVPIVAAVNGVAVGLGATLALMCDMIYASPTARFADTHVNAGVVAGDGGAAIWPLLLGPVRAKHYLMTGDFVNADEALSMGMINKVVETEKLLGAAVAYAELLASGPRDAVIWTKYSVNKILKQHIHLLLDTSLALETLTYNSPERKAAVASFAEKRKRFGDHLK